MTAIPARKNPECVGTPATPSRSAVEIWCAGGILAGALGTAGERSLAALHHAVLALLGRVAGAELAGCRVGQDWTVVAGDRRMATTWTGRIDEAAAAVVRAEMRARQTLWARTQLTSPVPPRPRATPFTSGGNGCATGGMAGRGPVRRASCYRYAMQVLG